MSGFGFKSFESCFTYYIYLLQQNYQRITKPTKIGHILLKIKWVCTRVIKLTNEIKLTSVVL